MSALTYCQISFRPNVELTATVRRFINDFYVRLLVGHEVSSRLALATHELLENAVAYAEGGETAVRVEVVDNQLILRTWNRASNADRAALAATIQRMRLAQDAESYYQERLAHAATHIDGGGLGLARVWAEANTNVRYELEGDNVVIFASIALERDAPHHEQ